MSNLPDQLQPRALCTLFDVVKRVPGYQVGDEGEVDEILNDLILQESRDFVEETGREIVAKNADTTRVFDIDDTVVRYRRLWIGDATSVSAVVLKQHSGSILQTLDATAWIGQPRVRDDWEPITALALPEWTDSPAFLIADTAAHITGVWGFPAIPATVRRAVATLVLSRYLNDVASRGTALADAADREEFNLGAATRAALDVRDRLRLYP